MFVGGLDIIDFIDRYARKCTHAAMCRVAIFIFSHDLYCRFTLTLLVCPLQFYSPVQTIALRAVRQPATSDICFVAQFGKPNNVQCCEAWIGHFHLPILSAYNAVGQMKHNKYISLCHETDSFNALILHTTGKLIYFSVLLRKINCQEIIASKVCVFWTQCLGKNRPF